MTTPWEQSQQRLLDLLSDRAVCGLSVEETAELQELQPDGWNDDIDAMNQTAATCCLGLGIDVTDPLPLPLRDRIKADANRVIGRELQ